MEPSRYGVNGYGYTPNRPADRKPTKGDILAKLAALQCAADVARRRGLQPPFFDFSTVRRELEAAARAARLGIHEDDLVALIRHVVAGDLPAAFAALLEMEGGGNRG